MTTHYGDDVIDLRKDNSFPKSSNKLRSFLERIRANLIDCGITFSIGDHTHEGTPISFKNSKNKPSASSGRSDERIYYMNDVIEKDEDYSDGEEESDETNERS